MSSLPGPEGVPLCLLRHLSRPEMAGVVAAVASAVADLHQRDMVHGAIDPQHVLVGPGGRPILSAAGQEAGESLDPAADVSGLGALLRWAGLAESGELYELAQAATAADPARRPTALQCAVAITAAVPDACLPGPSVALGAPGPTARALPSRTAALEALRERPPGPRRLGGGSSGTGRRSTKLAGVSALLVAAAAVAIVMASGSVKSGTKAPELSDGQSVSTSLEAPPAIPSTTMPLPALQTTLPVEPPCPMIAGTLSADIDGDGCSEPMHYQGGILEAGTVRWAVGDDGDQVATGDWRCRGRKDLALVHPPTGDVFVFDGWAGPGSDLEATAVIRVEGGFALRAADLGGASCQRLVLDRRDAPPVVVPVAGGGE